MAPSGAPQAHGALEHPAPSPQPQPQMYNFECGACATVRAVFAVYVRCLRYTSCMSCGMYMVSAYICSAWCKLSQEPLRHASNLCGPFLCSQCASTRDTQRGRCSQCVRAVRLAIWIPADPANVARRMPPASCEVMRIIGPAGCIRVPVSVATDNRRQSP